MTTRTMITGSTPRMAKAAPQGDGLPAAEGNDNTMLFDDPDAPGITLLSKINKGQQPGDGGTDKPQKDDDFIDPDDQSDDDDQDDDDQDDDQEDDDDVEFPKFGDDPGDDDDGRAADGDGAAFDEKAFDKETKELAAELDGKKKGKGGKTAAEAFTELRGKLKKAEMALAGGKGSSKRVAELEAELEKIKPLAEEVEGTRDRMKRMGEKYARLQVEESDDFIAKVTKPTEEMEEAIEQMAKAADIDVDEIYAAIGEGNVVKQDAMLEKLEEKLGKRQVGRVGRMADDWRAIQRTRANMLRNAQATVEAQRKAAEKKAQDEAKERVDSFRRKQSATHDKYLKVVPGMTDSSGELTPAGRKLVRAAMSVDPDKLNAGDQAFGVFSAQALPVLVAELKKLRAENRELKGKRGGGSLEGHRPRKTPAGNGGGDGEGGGLGLLDHMRKQTTF